VNFTQQVEAVIQTRSGRFKGLTQWTRKWAHQRIRAPDSGPGFGSRIRAPDSGPDSGPGFGSRIQVPGSGPRFGSRWTSSRQANHVPAARPVQGQQSKRQCSSTSTRTSAGFEYYRSHPHEHLLAIFHFKVNLAQFEELQSKQMLPARLQVMAGNEASAIRHRALWAFMQCQSSISFHDQVALLWSLCHVHHPYHFMNKLPYFSK